MLTVPEAAKKVGKDPETVRRWIRSGKLRSRRIGTQYLIDEGDLASFEGEGDMLPLPKEWSVMSNGEPQVDWVRVVRRQREGH